MSPKRLHERKEYEFRLHFPKFLIPKSFIRQTIIGPRFMVQAPPSH